MEDNHVGAVLVHDGQRLVGIVTDRDLGVKALADDLDPFEFELLDIMSSPVATVSSDASVADVAQLMLDRHVRRIPIVDEDAIRGLVTVDDLILERGVDPVTLAAIVRHQLSEPSRLKPRGWTRPGQHSPDAAAGSALRREAHRRRAYARLLRRTLAKTQLTLTDQAELALQIVLTGLLRRVNRGEAADALAQLPLRLRQYAVANIAAGPDLRIHRATIEKELDRRLEVGPTRAAQILEGAVAALKTSIDAGELRDLASQLPSDLKELLAPQ
jgi:CBS-domain-containing membrane protein